MYIKPSIIPALSVFLIIILFACRSEGNSNKTSSDQDSSKNNITVVEQTEKQNPKPDKANKLIKVRYFYSDSYRCASCRKIEAYTKNAVKEAFSKELDNGKMEFSLVDLDKDETKPSIEKYKLFTKSVIVSEFSGDEEVKWQNLDKVWTLLNNEEKFKEYIIKEVKAYLSN